VTADPPAGAGQKREAGPAVEPPEAGDPGRERSAAAPDGSDERQAATRGRDELLEDLDTPPDPGADPRRRLDPAARILWRISAALTLLPVAAVAVWGRETFDVPVPLPLVAGAIAVVAVLVVGVLPGLEWRAWRYEISQREIDLRRGVVLVRRTLVPIARIQHVDTESGPIQRALGLATVAFHTAAGKNEIPHLAVTEADRVRVLIAELTREPDDT
jgi:membrane protein YdbS with pleckstrin-like domain